MSEQVTDPAAPGAAERLTTLVKGRPEVEKLNALIKQRPEVGLGIAFAGGLILATILKRLAR